MIIGYIIASNEVAIERQLIGYLYREEPESDKDSGWRVFSGRESQEYADNPENFVMYNASTILEIDPSIAALLEAAAPVAFQRDARGHFVRISTEPESD